MIRLPRLLDEAMAEVCRLHPSSLSLEMNLFPLSTAVMTLPSDEPAVTVGRLIELYTPQGSAGIFRVQQAEQTFTGQTRLHLEHSLVTLADSILSGTGESTAAAAQALQTVLSPQSQWRLGSAPADETITLTYDHANVLQTLLDIANKLPGYMLACDQASLPWTLNLVPLPDDAPSECRLSRNLESVSIETDRSELCTRVYVSGLDAPLEADTIGQWGAVSRSISADPDLTAAELTALGRQYLAQHKDPLLTVSLNALDLSQATGESLDRFTLGHICRVCLPEHSFSIQQRVVTLAWPDLIAAPEQVRVTLANRASSSADMLAGLIVDTTTVKKRLEQHAALIREHKRLILEAEEAIELRAREIIANAEKIALKADKIDLEGLVTMSEFDSFKGSISDLWADEVKTDSISADYVIAGNGDFDDLVFGTLNGVNTAWKSHYVLTGIGTVSQSKRYLNVMLADGTTAALDVVTDVSITPTGTYLNYFGKA